MYNICKFSYLILPNKSFVSFYSCKLCHYDSYSWLLPVERNSPVSFILFSYFCCLLSEVLHQLHLHFCFTGWMPFSAVSRSLSSFLSSIHSLCVYVRMPLSPPHDPPSSVASSSSTSESVLCNLVVF